MGRLGRMHADQMEEIEQAGAGDIIALFGVDCASGDTFTGGERISPVEHARARAGGQPGRRAGGQQGRQANMAKALHRFTREDPTFRTAVDPETGDTIISGMGELHLEVYIERIKREFSAAVDHRRARR